MARRLVPPDVEGLTGKEAVFRILAYTRKPMRFKDIVQWLSDRGQEPLTVGQVAGGFYLLLNNYEKVVERTRLGTYRIHRAWNGRPLDEQDQKGGPPLPPRTDERLTTAAGTTPTDVAGLTGKEAVFRILAHTGRPMRSNDIDQWLSAHGQEPLTAGQVAGGFYVLLNNYDKVVERTRPGTYRVHSAWNGRPLDEQTKRDGRVASSHKPHGVVKRRRSVGVIIPCYGTYWDRSLVQWRNGALLGKQKGDEADVVDFAGQTGVYVLYQWPRVNYVGRTTENNLYQRLSEHANDKEEPRGPWDKFSWFGLRPVGDDGDLNDPEMASVRHNVTMMEALLISSLEPPFNNKGGDGMGEKYFQVPSPEIEEREELKIAKAMEKLFQKLRQG